MSVLIKGMQSVDGISTDCPEEYLERAKELKLDFYKPEEIP